jgi:O-antigen/teichoic acid export membrane protein
LVMPIAAVGHYALASGLTRQIHALLNPVGPVIYPAATQLHVQGDRPRLERLYHDGTRFVLLAMISIVLLSAFWAEDFYRVWIGGKYLTGSPFQSVAWLFRILLIGIAATYVSMVAGQILTGAGHVRLLAKTLMCGSVINLGMSFLLIGRYGLAGVAAGAVIASIAIDFIAVPLLLQRAVGLSVREFVRRACVRPVAVGIIQVAALWCIRLLGPATDWTHLVLQGALAGAVSVAVLLGVGVTAAERDRFLLQPLRRLGRGAGAPKKTSADLTTPA